MVQYRRIAMVLSLVARVKSVKKKKRQRVLERVISVLKEEGIVGEKDIEQAEREYESLLRTVHYKMEQEGKSIEQAYGEVLLSYDRFNFTNLN